MTIIVPNACLMWKKYNCFFRTAGERVAAAPVLYPSSVGYADSFSSFIHTFLESLYVCRCKSFQYCKNYSFASPPAVWSSSPVALGFFRFNSFEGLFCLISLLESTTDPRC